LIFDEEVTPLPNAVLGDSKHRGALTLQASTLETANLLRRTKQAKKAATCIAKLFGLRKQNRTHCIRVIIDATSTADIKTRSRWTRALKYAWRGRKTCNQPKGKVSGVRYLPVPPELGSLSLLSTKAPELYSPRQRSH
jgi:hypothetical protein